MTPAQAIAMLDRQIQKHGQSVTLTRLVPNGDPVSAAVKAFIRGYKPDELANGVQQGDSTVVISPTSLKGTAFEAAMPATNNKIEIAGRRRNIQMVDAVMIGDQLVRLNLQVRG
ncbi:hypothetical protein [Devosia sp. 1635]|uniref:hypothetical protein n=1 Tax=Devosia sp. 1635 TaxID=2726066 RepID=UPI001564330C|nr:hypothetical protein [Devosia sp. 1635]